MGVKNILGFIAGLTIFNSSAHAQVVSSGPCPCDIEVLNNFNVSKYLGTWYEYAKYPVYFETNGICIKAEYNLLADGNVGVKNSQVDETTGAFGEINGYATLASNGKLLIKFPGSPAFKASSNYWVLDTDYSTYSVVYSCQPKDQHSTIVWILTRERLPSTTTIDKAIAVLKKNNIALKPLTLTKQQGC